MMCGSGLDGSQLSESIFNYKYIKFYKHGGVDHPPILVAPLTILTSYIIKCCATIGRPRF